MAQYKVPQDVEADDKLLGPFNFRQFVYLMISGGLIALAIGLFQLFPLLAIIAAGSAVCGAGVAAQERPANGNVSGGDCVVLYQTAKSGVDAGPKGSDDCDYGAEKGGRKPHQGYY